MSEDGKPSSIIIAGDTSREAERVKDATARFKRLLEDHKPTGVGYIVIVFESPLSLKKPQVALATDHDAETLDRILHGILTRNRSRVIA